MQVKIYSTSFCPFCKKAKAFFQEQGIAFTEVDVEKDETAAKEMIEKSKQFGVPVIEINEEIIIGFDKKALEKALGLRHKQNSH